MRLGFSSYPEEERERWVLGQPAQLVILVSQMYWCAAVEAVLRGGGVAGSMADQLQVGWGVRGDVCTVWTLPFESF
jgi:hypothetical protein